MHSTRSTSTTHHAPTGAGLPPATLATGHAPPLGASSGMPGALAAQFDGSPGSRLASLVSPLPLSGVPGTTATPATSSITVTPGAASTTTSTGITTSTGTATSTASTTGTPGTTTTTTTTTTTASTTTASATTTTVTTPTSAPSTTGVPPDDKAGTHSTPPPGLGEVGHLIRGYMGEPLPAELAPGFKALLATPCPTRPLSESVAALLSGQVRTHCPAWVDLPDGGCAPATIVWCRRNELGGTLYLHLAGLSELPGATWP